MGSKTMKDLVPMGSYFRKLRGRAVRARRKVLKYPVKAIEMTRTAMVRDLTEAQVSHGSLRSRRRLSKGNWAMQRYALGLLRAESLWEGVKLEQHYLFWPYRSYG